LESGPRPRARGSRCPPMHAWGDHFSPILYSVRPVGVAGAGGGRAPCWPRRRSLRPAPSPWPASPRAGSAMARAAAAFAVLYLSNPTLHGINVRDIHPAAFAIPLIIAAGVGGGRRAPGVGGGGGGGRARRPRGTWRSLASASACGWALARRRWAVGVAPGDPLRGAAVARHERAHAALFRGEPLSAPRQALRLSRPHAARGCWPASSCGPGAGCRWSSRRRKRFYLLALLAPLGFSCRSRRREWPPPALPGLAVNLLSTDPLPLPSPHAVPGIRAAVPAPGSGWKASRRYATPRGDPDGCRRVAVVVARPASCRSCLAARTGERASASASGRSGRGSARPTR